MQALRDFVRFLVLGPNESQFDLSNVDCISNLGNYSNGRTTSVAGGLRWTDIAAVLITHKDFWTAVPLGVFDERCLDIRPHAKDMATHLFGAATPEDVNSLTVLLKRLRRYWMHGRSRARITRREFRDLLMAHHGRCRSCGYTFSTADLAAEEYADELRAEDQVAGLRPPHVDHIIPIFLGGTRAGNLQVLCAQCNLGKGAAVAWPLKAAMIRPFRPSDLLSLNAGLRWMALESTQRCVRCSRSVTVLHKHEELTVTRADATHGWVIENVRVVCTSCVQ